MLYIICIKLYYIIRLNALENAKKAICIVGLTERLVNSHTSVIDVSIITNYTTALLHYCTHALLHYCTAALLHYCTTALLHYCTTALLHYCTTTLLHYCTSAPMHCCTTAPLTVGQHGDIKPKSHVFKMVLSCYVARL